MELNDLLVKQQIDPRTVLVLRHRPVEPELRKVLPWLAAERPETFNAYQQTQDPRAEKAMQKAEVVASFIGHQSGKALFIGLYQRKDWRPLTFDEFWRVPAFVEMRAFGMRGFEKERELERGRESVLWFDLDPLDLYAEWKGRLMVHWPPPERSWWRWASRNRIPVHAIREESILEAAMPSWDELVLTWDELKILPQKWKAALAQWRGIYFIFDETDGKGYVGSASGSENSRSLAELRAERSRRERGTAAPRPGPAPVFDIAARIARP
jgi:hypothetical protein